MQKVKEDALVALKRGGKMVAISTNLITLSFLGCTPHKTTLVFDHKTVETIIRVWEVAGPTPD